MLDDPELIEFPCHIAIKVIGINTELFFHAVQRILSEFYDLLDCEISQRLSKNDQYLALSVKVFAKSREEIDLVFSALSKSSHVKMVI